MADLAPPNGWRRRQEALVAQIAAADNLGDRDALTQEHDIARWNAIAVEEQAERARRLAAEVEESEP